MADIDKAQGAQIPSTMVTKHRDMGDGTHATVVSADLAVGGQRVSGSNPIPISGTGGTLSVNDGGGSLTVDQATHDSLNANANVQVGNVDVGSGNPLYVVTFSEQASVDRRNF